MTTQLTLDLDKPRAPATSAPTGYVCVACNTRTDKAPRGRVCGECGGWVASAAAWGEPPYVAIWMGESDG